jgi:hypothetical protein
MLTATYGFGALVKESDKIPVTETRCLNITQFVKDTGEDRLDLVAGCVFGAVQAGDLKRAGEILKAAKTPSAEQALIYTKIVQLWDQKTADAVRAYATPKIKTWQWVAGVGFGMAAVGVFTATLLFQRHKN